jgi:hypothetical protein
MRGLRFTRVGQRICPKSPRWIARGSHAGKMQTAPDPRFRRSGAVLSLWQVVDSNHCRQCRLIYSQLPLAARATCQGCVATASNPFTGGPGWPVDNDAKQ